MVHVFLNVPAISLLSAGMDTFALGLPCFRHCILDILWAPFLHSLVMGSVGEFTVLIWVGIYWDSVWGVGDLL